MSTKVSYKGAQIAEVGAQQTKTLLTAGKYCEDDFTLANDDNPTAEENDVIFIDYDGTIRYSYSAEEFAALTALPPNPVHAGLTAQGWNWTLADAKEYVRKYGMQVIGQTYETTSGAWEFDIVLSDGFLSPTLGFYQTLTNGITFDFGDGSAPVTVAGTGFLTITHIYESNGAYTIKALPDSSCHVDFSTSYGNVFGTDTRYRDVLHHFRMGRNPTIGGAGYGRSSFYYSGNLETCIISKEYKPTTWNDTTNKFNLCSSLRALVIPDWSDNENVAWSGDRLANGAFALKYLSIPKSMSIFPWNGFYYCTSLRRVCMPEGSHFSEVSTGLTLGQCYALTELSIGSGLTNIYTNSVTACWGLQKARIPASVTSVGASAFNTASHMYELRLDPASPPTIANSNAFGGLNTNCKIYVPFSALAAYLTGTNYPAPATYTYVGFATYNSGATLPTQDGTAAYNVTWYATKGDAIAQTNAITEGNGKEIYCRYTAVA